MRDWERMADGSFFVCLFACCIFMSMYIYIYILYADPSPPLIPSVDSIAPPLLLFCCPPPGPMVLFASFSWMTKKCSYSLVVSFQSSRSALNYSLRL